MSSNMSKGVVQRRSVINDNTKKLYLLLISGKKKYIENITYAVQMKSSKILVIHIYFKICYIEQIFCVCLVYNTCSGKEETGYLSKVYRIRLGLLYNLRNCFFLFTNVNIGYKKSSYVHG